MARYGTEVHGTCSENPREFIGIRSIWCDTGDSPRGHGGGRATAAVGWAVKSSQSEDSTETATTAPLPGTVPTVASTGAMRWAVAGKKAPVTASRCMAPAAPLPGTVPVAADTREMRWDGAGKKGLVRALRCMAPAARIPEN